jgi:hypothetical protein
MRTFASIFSILLAMQPVGTLAVGAGDHQHADPAGIATSTCSMYMTTYEHNPDTLGANHDDGDEGVHLEAAYTSPDYIIWLQGYVSAYNQYENDGQGVGRGINAGPVLHFLYQRCSEAPDATFISVLPALIAHLKPEDSEK